MARERFGETLLFGWEGKMARLARKVAAINEAPALKATAPARTALVPATAEKHEQAEVKDYWITRNGVTYAGRHLILDLWEATGLDSAERVEKALQDAVKAAGATLLHIHVHKFSPNGGVSGVAVLSESHISVHTWPERGYAAFDIFMCGAAEPEKAVPVLKAAFRPKRMALEEHKRGII